MRIIESDINIASMWNDAHLSGFYIDSIINVLAEIKFSN